jgi:hypothetical protein
MSEDLRRPNIFYNLEGACITRTSLCQLLFSTTYEKNYTTFLCSSRPRITEAQLALPILYSLGDVTVVFYLLESHSYDWDSDEVAAVTFHGDLTETVGAGHGPRRQGHSYLS